MTGTGVLARISRLISRNSSLPARVDEPSKDETGFAKTDTRYPLGEYDWGSSMDRKRIHDELDEMDRTDELVSKSLDVISACATGYEPTQEDAFTWRFDKNRTGKPLQVLNDLKHSLDLGNVSPQIVRSFVKYGNHYRENVYDDDLSAVRFKPLLEYNIWPNQDKLGNKIPGFEQRKYGDKPGTGIQLADYQVTQFLYQSEDGLFGRGLMEPARGTYGRLRKVEDGMVVARMIRAYDKMKHVVPVPAGATVAKRAELVELYKKQMTTRTVIGQGGSLRSRQFPVDVATDYYVTNDGTNKNADVQNIASQNTQLQHIDDVEYLRERLLVACSVPRVYLNLGTGNEGAITDSGSGTEDMQFARTLRMVQAVLRHGLLTLGTYALLFKGYDAGDLGLRIDMPRVNTENFLQESKVTLNMAQAAQAFAEILGGLPVEIVAKTFMNLTDTDRDTLSKALDGKEFVPYVGKNGSNSVAGASGKPAVAGDDTTVQSVEIDDLARSMATLRVRTQRALGRDDFAVGSAEAFNIAKSAILDALCA